MGLAFYHDDKSKADNTGGAITTSHNGTLGESVEVLVYLRNDTNNIYYDNIEVWAEDSESPDDTIGVYGTGWGVKLSASGRQPTAYEWDNVLAGDSISMPNIGTTIAADTTSYFPFWVKVTVPGNTPAQNKTSIKLKVRAASHTVGS